MHDDANETYYTASEIYALEDAHFLYSGPLSDDSEPEEPINDVGHPLDCSCPVCLPERYDAAEREAGQPDRWVA
jgi:hypothetical protein